ncbi:MAG: YbjN domain-containing protein [Oscillospiraceae bacterium]|nr:YbjN domain-containing protein [Oscillospiraceae bacterium]
MEEKQLAAAENVYKTVCAMLDSQGWRYEKHPEKKVVWLKLKLKNGLSSIMIVVEARTQTITFYAPVDFPVKEEKCMDMVLATVMANDGMVFGSFDYDMAGDEIRFRLTQSFRESQVEKELIEHMLLITASMVEKYVPRFLALNTGIIDIEDFMAKE